MRMYPNCDTICNCLNGIDELDCDSSLQVNCSSEEHLYGFHRIIIYLFVDLKRKQMMEKLIVLV